MVDSSKGAKGFRRSFSKRCAERHVGDFEVDGVGQSQRLVKFSPRLGEEFTALPAIHSRDEGC